MLLRSLPLLFICAAAAPALAQQTPRELNTLPGTPRSATPQPTTPAPASTAVAPAAVPTDTVRRAPAPRTLASPPAVPEAEQRPGAAPASTLR